MYTNLYRTFVSRDAHNMRLHYRKNKFNESIESHRNTQDPDNHKYSPLIFIIGCSLPNRMLSDRRSRCTQCFIQHFTISLS